MLLLDCCFESHRQESWDHPASVKGLPEEVSGEGTQLFHPGLAMEVGWH